MHACMQSSCNMYIEIAAACYIYACSYLYAVLIHAVLHICNICVEIGAACYIYVAYMQFWSVQFCIYVTYM